MFVMFVADGSDESLHGPESIKGVHGQKNSQNLDEQDEVEPIEPEMDMSTEDWQWQWFEKYRTKRLDFFSHEIDRQLRLDPKETLTNPVLLARLQKEWQDLSDEEKARVGGSDSAISKVVQKQQNDKETSENGTANDEDDED